MLQQQRRSGPENEWQASEFEVDGKVGDTI
jgi:hypothetical protein